MAARRTLADRGDAARERAQEQGVSDAMAGLSDYRDPLVEHVEIGLPDSDRFDVCSKRQQLLFS